MVSSNTWSLNTGELQGEMHFGYAQRWSDKHGLKDRFIYMLKTLVPILITTVVSCYYDTGGIRKKYHNIETIERFSINFQCFVIVWILIWYHNKQHFALSDIVITRDCCNYMFIKATKRRDYSGNMHFIQLFDQDSQGQGKSHRNRIF